MTHTRGAVVVGVDGSAESDAALVYALGRARVTRSRLDVVTAWAAPDEMADTEEDRAARVQDKALATVLTDIGDDLPVISRWVVRGEAGTVLERAARHAISLVLGHPSGRGLVADYCAAHSRVPLVLVPILMTDPGSSPTDPVRVIP